MTITEAKKQAAGESIMLLTREEHSEAHKYYPCDFKGYDDQYHCPYEDTYTGYESEMCRVCCGLGVDE